MGSDSTEDADRRNVGNAKENAVAEGHFSGVKA